MKLSDKERKHLEDIVKANKWFTFEEAEKKIRKHWNPFYSKNDDYLSTQRRQLQKIIRSDIKGTYLKINNRKPTTTDEEWFKQNAYKGWSRNLFSDNKIEKLHVFPKYDYLFKENEQSIVLSALDDELDDIEKSDMRDIYENLYGTPGKGKTKYIMTEPYLFALKHEIERREYPTKTLYLLPHSPKEIISKFNQSNFRKNILTEIDSLIDEFALKVANEVKAQQLARNVELDRYEDILSFLRTWNDIFPQVINLASLEKNNMFKQFLEAKSKLSKSFFFDVKENVEKEKLHSKYSFNKIAKISDKDLKKKIKNSIYSFESYTLSNLELLMIEDNVLSNQASNIRHNFSRFLYQYLEKNNADNLIFDALRNAGIKDI